MPEDELKWVGWRRLWARSAGRSSCFLAGKVPETTRERSKSAARGASSSEPEMAPSNQTPIIAIGESPGERQVEDRTETEAEIDELSRGIQGVNAASGRRQEEEEEEELVDSLGPPNGSQPRRPSQFEAVDEVRENFIELLRYNKLQCFYLGALIYSVINIALNLSSPPIQSVEWIGQNGTRAGSPASQVATQSQRRPPTGPSWTSLAGWSPLVFLIMVALGLLLCIGLAWIQFALGSSPVVGSRASRLGWLNTLGAAIVALQPYLHVLAAPDQTGTDSRLSLLVALTYLQPLLFESAQSCLIQRFIGHLSALVPAATWLWLHFSSLEDSAPATPSAELACFGAALLLGYRRRATFTGSVGRSSFRGASQLIEAKVNLEHQRQQQETLLLSVLPAYVAEQVKRNMLKKTNSSPSASASFAGGPAANPEGAGSSCVGTPSQQHSPPGMSSLLRVQLAGDRFSFSSISRASLRRCSLQQQPPAPSTPSQGAQLNLSNQYLATAGTKHTLIPQINAPPLPVGLASGHNPAARRGFNELYIRTYNNVSLLYGDIVGFTRLCTQLSSSQLVRVLNDLFSRFDYLAEKHKIMRIKILGDCYYGVSGIPEFAVMGAKSRAIRNDNHAINCVNMGLDMIKYIRCLNVERASRRSTDQEPVAGCLAGSSLPEFELNMRIGIHSGHIHSGVIGLKKWQFDVWSNDVSIAIHCESSGMAGRVQVTEATRQQLNGAFACELVPESRRDAFLVDRQVLTYLIKEPGQGPTTLDAANRTVSDQQPAKQKHQLAKTGDELDNIRKATIGTIRQTALSNVEGCSSSLVACTLSHHDLRALSLAYHDKALNRLYLARPGQNLVGQSFRLLLLLGLLLPALNLLSGPDEANARRPVALATAGVTLALLFLALFLASNSKQGNNITADFESSELSSLGPPEEMADPDVGTFYAADQWPKHEVISHQPKLNNTRAYVLSLSNTIRSTFSKLSRGLTRYIDRRGSPLRNYSILLLFLVVIGAQFYLHAHLATSSTSRLAADEQQLQLTVIVILMALDSSSSLLFYRSRAGLILVLSTITLLAAFGPLDKLMQLETQPQQIVINNGNQIGWIFLFVLALWSLVYARQLEYTSRASFLWRNRLNVDHEELEYISGINKVLLENILPSHVVQYYLTHPGEQLKSHLSTSLRASYMRMSK